MDAKQRSCTLYAMCSAKQPTDGLSETDRSRYVTKGAWDYGIVRSGTREKDLTDDEAAALLRTARLPRELPRTALGVEILLTLGLAGGALAITQSWKIALAVAFVMAIVVMSYRQNVHAYPSGGGDYEVATENLGPKAGLTVASAS